MKHLSPITRKPAPAQFGDLTGGLEIAEQVVILLLTAFFSDWINFSTVIQDLQKFYSKT